MGHDAQATLQDSSNDCHIGAMPQQMPVLQVVMHLESIALQKGVGKGEALAGRVPQSAIQIDA